MVLQTKPLTLEEFHEFINQPENTGKLFELINGQIVEVSPGRTRYSQIGHILAVAA